MASIVYTIIDKRHLSNRKSQKTGLLSLVYTSKRIPSKKYN